MSAGRSAHRRIGTKPEDHTGGAGPAGAVRCRAEPGHGRLPPADDAQHVLAVRGMQRNLPIHIPFDPAKST